MNRRTFALALAVVAAAPLAPLDALADAPPPKADVLVLHASQSSSPGIDPRILEGDSGELRKKLGEPPFSSYNTYKQLDRQTPVVPKGGAATITLPNGRTLRVTTSEPGKDGRYKVQASISSPDGRAYLKQLDVLAGPKQPVFVAGQPYEKGTLVLVLRIVP